VTPLTLVRASRVDVEPEIRETDLCDVALRSATEADAPAMHELIVDHQLEGHLLPRTLGDVRRYAERFVVACAGDRVVACGELAPLGRGVAEIRSLVVDRGARKHGLGEQIFTALKSRAERQGIARLCAFTHEPRYFIRLGFSIVPHTWVPEKISTDCCTCPQFRRCGQFGMLMDLRSARTHRAALLG
jgi:N-acetylglutamate synthase-like GNAT family acetyltransferase